MDDDGVWHIAPAYDFTFSIDPSAPGYVNRHCLTVGNKISISVEEIFLNWLNVIISEVPML